MNFRITENAAKRVAELIAKNTNKMVALRISVDGGGCSGFTYVWDTTDLEPTVGNLHVDPIAEMFVLGCTIDYVSELGGSYLKVINPNATASCGCGESFAV